MLLIHRVLTCPKVRTESENKNIAMISLPKNRMLSIWDAITQAALSAVQLSNQTT